MARFEDRRAPVEGTVYRFISLSTHRTKAWPDALKERKVLINAYLNDVWILFGTGSTASSLAVDISQAQTSGTSDTQGYKLEKDHPDGYEFFISGRITLCSVESSASAYITAVPVSRQQQAVQPVSAVGD